MFSVSIDGSEHIVEFSYDRGVERERTYCYISTNKTSLPKVFVDKPDWVTGAWVVGQGEAECVPPDQFEKNVGRKISLRKALESNSFDRDLRELFWEEYFRTRNGNY